MGVGLSRPTHGWGLALAATVGVAAFVTPPLWANDGEDPAKFPQQVEIAGKKLVLNGSGLCEWGFFGIDLYHAALYLEQKSAKAAKIIASDGPKRIELRFVRSLTRKQMVEAYTESAKATAGRAFSKYEKSLKQFTSKLTAVKAGSVLVTDYIPGKGLELRLDGKAIVVVEDAAFVDLFFTMYLGSKPPTKELKKALLGG